MSKPSVLIVDPDGTQLEAIADAFEAAGAEIEKASTGDEALQLLITRRYSVLVYDMNMPGLAGIELLEMIQHLEATRHMMIFFTSAAASEEEELKAYEAGAVDYLAKPVASHLLQVKVKTYLGIQKDRSSHGSDVAGSGLAGILPTCMHCHKINGDEDQWQDLETWVRTHSQLQFSHGICPTCMEDKYPELDGDSGASVSGD